MTRNEAKNELAVEAGLAAQEKTSRVDHDVEKDGGIIDNGHEDAANNNLKTKQSAFKSLGLLDRFLAVWILLAMVVGVLLRNFVPKTATALEKGEFAGVSVPIGELSPLPRYF